MSVGTFFERIRKSCRKAIATSWLPISNRRHGSVDCELLQEALDNLHQGLCMFDPQGRALASNKLYAEIHGIPPEAIRPGITGRELLELSIAAGHFPGMDIDQVEDKLRSALGAGSETYTTFERQNRHFAVRHRVSGRGNWVATFEDITSEVETEAALRDSEARLSAILDAMPDCVKIFDESGDLVYINPSGLKLLQAPSLKRLKESGHISVPPEYLDACLKTHVKVIAGEKATNNYEIVGMEGRRRFVEAHAVPVNLPSGKRAHLCISRDVTERRKSEDALRRSEERLRLVQDATGLAEFEAGPDGVAVVSERLLDQLGLPKSDRRLPFEKLLARVDPRDRDKLQQAIDASLQSSECFQCEFRIVRADNGETRWISSHTKMKRDAEGKPVRSIGAHIDITERKWADQALRESEERFRLAAEATNLGIWDYNPHSEEQDWSDRFREIVGLPAEKSASLSEFMQRIHPDDRNAFMSYLLEMRAAEQDHKLQKQFRISSPSDRAESWITLNGWKTNGGVAEACRIIFTIRDVTEEKTATDRVRWAATHDGLTGLPNRTQFSEVLDAAIQRASELDSSVGLLLLDLDHFKQINDTLGHDVGDLLLETFGDRLKAAVRSGDTVARLGGDEFAIVLPDIRGSVSLECVAAQVFEGIKEPFVHQGNVLECKASIGASLFPIHGRSSDELLKCADIALYSTKARGRGRLTVFHPQHLEELLERDSMIRRGKEAVRDQRIVPYYQPKVELASGRIRGFEALLRLNERDGCARSPASIAAAFDDSEVAANISDQMLNQSICDIRGWLDQGIDFGHVALNASAAEFSRGGFADGVLERLEKEGVPPNCLQIEVTETVFLGRGAEYVLTALKALDYEGVKIALDDFGTGYASLRHLKEFPVEIIKIDQSFVRDMNIDPGDEAIVRAVINLAKSLDLSVVAEGIETIEQAQRLCELGCDFGQGYLYSRAVKATQVSGLLDRGLVAGRGFSRQDIRPGRPRLIASNN